MSGQLHTLVTSLSTTPPTNTTAPQYPMNRRLQVLRPVSTLWTKNKPTLFWQEWSTAPQLSMLQPSQYTNWCVLAISFSATSTILQYKACCTVLTLSTKWSQLTKMPKNMELQTGSENKLVCTVPVLYVRGVSVKFRISARYNIRTVFKTKYTLGIFF